MPELRMLMGLPYSGKSTRARQMAEQDGTPIVSPDAIRFALTGQRFQPLAEPFVWATAKLMVRALFEAGHRLVILDATNTTRKRRDEWRDAQWHRSIYVIETPVSECLARAERSGDGEIRPIIERMALAWEAPLAEEEFRNVLVAQGGMLWTAQTTF